MLQQHSTSTKNVWSALVFACLALAFAWPQVVSNGHKPRVFVKGQGTVNSMTQGGGNRSGLFGQRWDTVVDVHNESIELTKNLRESCPEITVTLKEETADFFVMLNRESKAKKGVLSKNSQVLVANKDGDVIWTKDVRRVSSAAKDVCTAILNVPAGPISAPTQAHQPKASAMLADARIPDAETANLSAVGNSPKANFIPTTGANSSRTSDKGNPPVVPQQSVAGPRPVAAENESGNELSTAIAETTHELRANVDQGHGGYFGATSNDTARVRHNGVTLSGVELNGPAYAAGLQAGDVILAMDGKYIYTVEEMTAEIRRRTPGTRIDIKYMRGGTIYETYAVLVGTARF